MKKKWMLSMSMLLPLMLAGCGGGNASTKVGLIVSAAGANDNGYNQSAIAGLTKAASDFNISQKVVNSADDVPGSLEALAEDGYKLIFSLEYNFDALITNDGSGKSIAEKYPDTTFVVFNAFANTDSTGVRVHDNVVEVLFNIAQSSFLAGALAVMVNEANDVLFTSDDYHFTPVNQYRGVGFIGGTQSDGITVFGNGFAQGANYAAQDADVNYNLYQTYSAGFGASTENYNTIASYYDAGVNVVFAAAGGVSTNMKNAASNKGKLSIDVDANQDASVPGYVLTSVLKNTEVAVYDLVGKFLDNKLTEKDYYYDLDSGATGITDLATISSYIDTSEAAQAKWTEIKGKIEDIKDDIADGTIMVVDSQKGETLDFSTLHNITKAN